ncbi:MAG: hypothetical protein HUU50_19650 [Candidatus Brocadiae bacterium]|nr:hypothetical protein [Candidatus Brocadiia bacterium]
MFFKQFFSIFPLFWASQDASVTPISLIYGQVGKDWFQASTSAPTRQQHTSVVFDDKIWIIGGDDTNGSYLNDVWSSSDGINWTQVTAHASWPARQQHTSVLFDDKIWIIGGSDGVTTRLNDVWYSSDGVNYN